MGACSCGSQNPDWIDLSWFKVHRTIGAGAFGSVSCVSINEGKYKGKMLAMKKFCKSTLLQNNHSQMVIQEKDIMARISDTQPVSNFLITLLFAFQDRTYLYLVMEYMQGGSLRYQMDCYPNKIMPENVVRFYGAEMILGLKALHNLKIIYRDMKPENCLLDAEGHLHLSDFGLAYHAKDGSKTSGSFGTFGYQAPEMLLLSQYDREVDVWAFGVTLYEMLHGRLTWDNIGGSIYSSAAPTHHRGVKLQKDDIKDLARFGMNKNLSSEAQSLIKGLLQVDARNRLGCGPKGWEEVTSHPFFSSIDWAKMERREIKPPIKPSAEANFDRRAEMNQLISAANPKPRPVAPQEDQVFENFEYHTELKWVGGVDDLPQRPPRESLSVVSHTLGVITEVGKAEDRKSVV